MRVLLDERGGVAVTVALVIPVVLLVMSFTVDAANWWVHKRHLQTQADAAALAGAARVQKGCSQAAVLNEATLYGTTKNPEVGVSPQLELNSATYHGQSSPIDGTVETGDPCAVMSVDVKMTEHDVPGLFQKLLLADNVNAHARVDIKQIDSSKGALPLAFKNTRFTHVAYQFVDETVSPPAPVGSVHPVLDGEGDGTWEEAAASAATLTVDRRRIGVRVGASNSGPIGMASDGRMACGGDVHCYDAGAGGTGGTSGLSFLRGYTTDAIGSQKPPRVRDAYLDSGLSTCAPDPYFADVSGAECRVALKAVVDWNSDVHDADIAGKSPAASITANGQKLYRVGTTGNVYETGTWQGNTFTPGATIVVGQGATVPVTISMSWEQQLAGTKVDVGGATLQCKGNNSNPCKGDFEGGDAIQRVFPASDDRSGPITAVDVYEQPATGLAFLPPHSFRMCESGFSACGHRLTVKVRFQDLTSTVMLRANGTGSQNQSVDCGPSLKVTLAQGCTTRYDVAQPGETCEVDPAEPFHCVQPATGGKVGQIDSLNDYFLKGSSSCTVGDGGPPAWNNWPNLTQGDPRLVKVFVTSFDSFQDSGHNDHYEVLGFAYMYVTGWQAQKNDNNNPCADVTGPHADEPTPDPAFQKASIWGHFVSWAGPNSGDDTPGTHDCDFNNPLVGCVASLVE
jgi:hypothetical protein